MRRSHGWCAMMSVVVWTRGLESMCRLPGRRIQGVRSAWTQRSDSTGDDEVEIRRVCRSELRCPSTRDVFVSTARSSVIGMSTT
eukprot:41989-Pleurochrysis_carterae.AAC.1